MYFHKRYILKVKFNLYRKSDKICRNLNIIENQLGESVLKLWNLLTSVIKTNIWLNIFTSLWNTLNWGYFHFYTYILKLVKKINTTNWMMKGIWLILKCKYIVGLCYVCIYLSSLFLKGPPSWWYWNIFGNK